MVGNFDVKEVEGQFPNVYVLQVAGGDLVISSSWLKTLKAHITDYDSLFIRFLHKGEFVTLRGDVELAPTQAQFHHVRRWMYTDAMAEIYSLHLSDTSTEPPFNGDCAQDLDPELAVLLHTYRMVFQTPIGLLPPREHDHTNPLVEGAEPVKVRPYRYPHSQKVHIESMVQKMLTDGIIQPSKSPFSSPILLVKKKDGTWRFCTDYRALNAITIKDSFLIPTVDELLDELHGATYFSKLDLRLGYHQILVNPTDRHKTTFRTHQGHYEWLVMPFGLTNAPATFQALMNDVFKPYLRRFVLVFFDDISIYSPTRQIHLTQLELVLQLLQK